MDKKKFSFVILFAVLIAGILTIFLLPKTTTAPTKTSSPTPTPKSPEICKQFEGSEVAGEISCQEAINKASSLYSGKITDVIKADKMREPDEPVEAGINVWQIEIALNKPYEKNGEIMQNILVIIVRKTGNIFGQYYFNQ